MRVAGVDQSYTAFGHCFDGVSKKKGFPATKYAGPVERLDAIYDWFYTWLNSILPLDLLVMEGYAHGAKVGREMAGELGGVVKIVAFDLLGSDHILIVPPTSLKKFVTSRGNAKKNEMLLGVFKRWGVEFTDDNQADAYALEKFGLACLDAFNWPNLHKYEVDALAKVGRGPGA